MKYSYVRKTIYLVFALFIASILSPCRASSGEQVLPDQSAVRYVVLKNQKKGDSTENSKNKVGKGILITLFGGMVFAAGVGTGIYFSEKAIPEPGHPESAGLKSIQIKPNPNLPGGKIVRIKLKANKQVKDERKSSK